MSPSKDKNQSMAKQIDFFDFIEKSPIGIYQADLGGVIVYCNEEFMKILDYTEKEELIGKRLKDFYIHPEERKRLLEKMRETKAFQNETLYWRSKSGRELCLSDSCQFIYDKDGNEVCVRGVIRDVWYRKLFDNMNTGIYRIASDLNTIEKANLAVVKMFGYDSPEEMEGMDVARLYKDKEDLAELKKILEREDKVENYPIRMVKKNGEEIVISVNTTLIRDEKGEILCREGTFTDVTEIQLIRDILEEMPTGAYQIKIRNNSREISYCNRAFARLFGFDTPEDIKGKDVRTFYADAGEVDKFERELLEADAKGESLLDHRVQVKNRDGDRFWVEIDSHLLKDHRGNIIGRQGTLRDATAKIHLEKLTRRGEDVQRFAHRFMAPTISMKSSSDALIDEVGTLLVRELSGERKEVFKGIRGDPVAIFGIINELSKKLLEDIENLVSLAEERGLDISFKQWLEEFIREMSLVFEDDQIENIIELREIHRRVRDFLKTFPHNFLKDNSMNGEIRNVLSQLADIDRYYILYLSQIIINTSKIAYVDVEKLRSYLLRWDREISKEPFEYKLEHLKECIKEVIDIYQIYAIQKGIKIQFQEVYMPKVEISKENVQKMLHYLIENAVKYSFKRDGYIHVKTYTRDQVFIIEIDNYGVGILPEEIASDKIYQYGYRGEFSKDWNRTGSGIGLSEARTIAMRHGGSLTISSRPVGDSNKEINEDTPHVTTVEIILPIKHGNKEKSK
jgi:PAS domain S-box-containing protein